MSDAKRSRAVPVTRRDAVRTMGMLAGGAAMTAPLQTHAASAPQMPLPTVASGRLRQSASRWCYDRIPLDALCEAAKGMGLAGIDLLDEADWKTPARHGLVCSLANGFGTIPKGFNRPDLHDQLVAAGSAMIPKAAAAGVERIVCFSGNRAGLSDGDGIQHCITGLKRLAPLAEQHEVTLCLELLNSKVDHKDYQADHTAWGVEVIKGVNSPRVRLLYDIYHMQIMEGDVVATIKQYAPFIAHYHTGGVPGRHEIDDTQELNYRRVAQVIADTGFTGFLAHEFVPVRDPLTSLREAAERCTV
ncbi:MAG: TIM barrel protein [Gemmatimonadaceae bacterium]